MEQQNNEIKKKEKKIRAPYRYMEDGSYNNKPLDPDYFNKYYHKRTEIIPCNKCGLECKRNYLYKHGLTNKCKKGAAKIVEELVV